MKLILTVILSGQAYEKLEVERFDRLRIGREKGCEIHLDNVGISRYHCEITRKGDLLRLRDLGSQNGTLLNGVRIENHSLNTGDVISIGKFTIDVALEGIERGSRRLQPDRAPPGQMTIEGDREILAQAQAAGEQQVRGYLTVSGGDGEKDLLLEKLCTLFGRDRGADVRVGGYFAPRLAAVLIREDFGFRLIDLSKRGNSVRVNGRRASDVRLGSGDQVQVRKLKMRFFHGRPMGR